MWVGAARSDRTHRIRDAVEAALSDIILLDTEEHVRLPGRPAVRRISLWWSGIGFAAALAGATAGITIVARLAPNDLSSDGATAFGDPQES